MPIDRYKSEDPFGNHPLFKSEEQARIEETMGGTEPAPAAVETKTLKWPGEDEDEVTSGVEDGDALNPHAMDPETVLRFIKLTGGWPGKVVIIACEPLTIEEMGVGLSPVVEEAVGRAVDLVLEQAKELLTDEAYASLDEKK